MKLHRIGLGEPRLRSGKIKRGYRPFGCFTRGLTPHSFRACDYSGKMRRSSGCHGPRNLRGNSTTWVGEVRSASPIFDRGGLGVCCRVIRNHFFRMVVDGHSTAMNYTRMSPTE